MPTDDYAEGRPNDVLQETYLRAKRYLVFFSGALLLSVLIGVDPNSENAVLPWKIGNADYWQLILYAAVLYHLAQLALFWDALPQPAKEIRQHTIDFWMSVVLGIFALEVLALAYLVSLKPVILPSEPPWVEGQDGPWGALGLYLLPWGLVLLPAVGFWIYASIIRVKVKQEKVEEGKRVGTMAYSLVSHLWELVFNPTAYDQTGGRSGSKQMLFDEAGVIAEGQNSNEYSWQINGELLEFLDSRGSVFSRFRYDPALNRFEHTNDSDTRSIKGQYMIARAKMAAGHPPTTK